MHIPDGFLDAKTAATLGVLAVAGVGVALAQTRRHLPPRRVPLLGLTAAFVFAAQMINFPVAGGTSGHLVGAVLAAALLGPSAAVVTIAAVLIVQCLLFADGGITTLGANVFNMGIVGAVFGWGVYRGVCAVFGGLRGQVLAAAFASWCATVAAAIACALELAASSTVAWSVAFPAMAGVHMLIGVGEAVITALVLASIAQVRPDLVRGAPEGTRSRSLEMAAYGLLLSLAVAVLLSPLASSSPDGLDRVASDLNFAGKAATKPLVDAPMSEYKLEWFGRGARATSLAGGIGTIVVFGLSFLLARALVPREARSDAQASTPTGAA